MGGPRLEQLCGESSIDEFAGALFGHDVLVLPAIRSLPDAFGIADFERLIWSCEQSLPAHLCALRDGVERSIPRRSGGEYFRWAIDEFRDGSALIFADLHRVDPYFLPLACDLADAAQADVSVCAMLLPGNVALSRPDKMAAIVFQSTGSVRISGAGSTHDLSRGDAVYFAESVDWSIVATAGPALTIVLTFRPDTRRDFLDRIAEIVAEEDECSRRGMIAGRAENPALVHGARARLADLGSHPRIRRMAAERLALGRVNRLRPMPGHHLAAIAMADGLNLDSRVEVPAAMLSTLVEREDRIHLYIPGLGVVDERRTEPGGLVFPIAAAALLRALLARRGPLTARDLPTIYSEQTRLTVLKRLAWEGALAVCEPTS